MDKEKFVKANSQDSIKEVKWLIGCFLIVQDFRKEHMNATR